MNPRESTLIDVIRSKCLLIYQRSQITRKVNLLFSRIKFLSVVFLFYCVSFSSNAQNQNMTLDESSDYYVNAQTLGRTPIAGDTIFVNSTRTFPLRFEQIQGDSLAPVVVINKGGQVKINDTISNTWGAITFENCKYIKISGSGHPGYKYGFELSAVQSGLGFIELSSDCEAEFIKISHNGFFGIVAKKDYGGIPPTPYPVFENLIIHDCFVENVSEGMYLGETKTPGMEFKHVKIYNNIVRNTGRESIQIANMVEDVEIYNNTLINSGLEGAIYQMNNLQIGNNSVVNAYNNILMDAPVFGIINLGKGHCVFNNNYIASSQGIFCDNRSVSDTLAPIDIRQNYFKSINGNQVVRNMNEINYLTAEDNKYDTNISFYLDETGVDNDTLNNNTLTTVQGIQFTDSANNDYSLAASTATEYLSLGAPGGPEFFEFNDPATTPRQLVITPSMVVDSVQGGSIFSPLFLFDEQNIDVNANEHATSNPWKPDYVMTQNSYHAIVDLGDEHYISEINLHDINDTHSLTVEYFDGIGWNTLFVEPCDAFNVWKTHITDVSTRYIRFSMYDSPYAAVNEIIIHGYPIIKTPAQVIITPEMVTDLVSGGSVFSPLNLFDEQSLDVSANEHAISESWKPYFNENNAPYYATIDLGQDYHISKIQLHDMNSTFDFIVEYGDGLNWNELFVEPCDNYNAWKTHSTDIVTRYLRLSMLQSPYALVNEMIISGYPIMTIQTPEPKPEITEAQIVVTPGMVSDLVTGGSVISPQFLFDEQTVDPVANEHPTSNSWKPYYTNANAPYYVTINFGESYHISKIYMHDMNSVYDFNVEYDDNSNWSTLFVEPCDAFNIWKMHETNIDTQYLRLGMIDSPYAAVNEIILYGYPLSNTAKRDKKKAAIKVGESFSQSKIEVYPNPVTEKLYLRFPKQMIGSDHIQIFNILGKEIYSHNINITSNSPVIELNTQEFLSAPGFCVLSCINEFGHMQTVKFLKE